jgi:hypothetical protein
MKKVCVTSLQSIGCTFVDWSIQFLSGQLKYYNIAKKSWYDISYDPITKINSHGHLKNHPSGYDKTVNFVNEGSLVNQSVFSFYPYPKHLDEVLNGTGIVLDEVYKPEIFAKVQQTRLDDYNKIFEFCNQQDIKTIFVANDCRTALYHITPRSLDRFLASNKVPTSVTELKNEHQQIFFSKSIETWEKLGLTEIWDVRERLALDCRFFNLTEDDKVNLVHPHLWINCQDLWYRPVEVIKKIFEYIEIDIDPTRFEHWLSVCTEWQKIQLDLLEFSYNYQHIVDAIINNWYYEIDLTFDQEVVIQHCLIYNHNLNLKTWQLSKFPNNTQDLHKLLEPNIHTL